MNRKQQLLKITWLIACIQSCDCIETKEHIINEANEILANLSE